MDNQNSSCCQSWHGGKMHKVFGILIGLVVLAVFFWLVVVIASKIKEYPYIDTNYQERNTIAITGEGEVVAIPDIALVTLGVITEKSTVSAAQQENTVKMNKVIEKIKSLGVEDKDIKTASYYISSQYDWNKDGQRVFRGYQVSQSVTVKIRKVDQAGAVLSAATELGVNQISDLSFTVDDMEKVKQEARLKALANAKEKAKALSKAAGVSLGRIISFSENADMPYPVMKSYALAEGMGGAVDSAPTVQAGSIDVKMIVTVSYVIK